MEPAPLIDIDSLPGLIASLEPAAGKVFVLTDRLSYRYCRPSFLDAVPSLKKSEFLCLGHGEKDKNLKRLGSLARKMVRSGADRQSILVNLGGGVTTDMGGILASVLKRGIRFIHVPTSLTAMVDASVGGKTAVNIGAFKNQIGTYACALAITIHPEFLNTLPKRHKMAGFAEMLKHGLIADESHWKELIERGADNLDDRLIRHSIALKESIVREDPYENGKRAILNFGHTIGHALEAFQASGKDLGLTHGHAIALGMRVAVNLSVGHAGLNVKTAESINRELESLFPAPLLKAADVSKIIGFTMSDKKSEQDSVRYVLLEKPGKAIHGITIPERDVHNAIVESLHLR